MSSKAQLWQEVKKRYHLSDGHIQMAQRLNLNPKKMGGYAPNKSQRWKEPLSRFIEKIFAKQYPQSEMAKKLRSERKATKAARRIARHQRRDGSKQKSANG